MTDPESFISCDVHRLFTSNGGVYRGSVLSYDDDTKFWKVKYDCDETVEEYDVDDMADYAIRCIEGKSPADGGAAQWIKHCQGANDAPPGPEPEPWPLKRWSISTTQVLSARWCSVVLALSMVANDCRGSGNITAANTHAAAAVGPAHHIDHGFQVFPGIFVLNCPF